MIPYAYLAVGAVVVASLGYGTIQHYRADSAALRAKAAEQVSETLANELRQSEADKQGLMEASKKLNAALVARDKRARELENAKRAISKELDAIKAKLPKEDQDCLNRSLPPAIAERLRNGADHKDEGSQGVGSGKPDNPLP